jgi:uncharacterized glyoxalase superfamily protein PhnB
MKPTPKDWPRISVALWYKQPLEAIDWLCNAFGFEVKLKVVGEDGELRHSELTFGGGLVMVGAEKGTKHRQMPYRRSPLSLAGANTQNMMVHVDDVDAHCARARAAGATIIAEPTNADHGHWENRTYEAEDLEGHHWWFSQRIRG